MVFRIDLEQRERKREREKERERERFEKDGVWKGLCVGFYRVVRVIRVTIFRWGLSL